jgi:hypothetical protein
VESNRHDLEKIFGHLQTADFTSKSVFVALVVISSWKKGLWRRRVKIFINAEFAGYNISYARRRGSSRASTL